MKSSFYWERKWKNMNTYEVQKVAFEKKTMDMNEYHRRLKEAEIKICHGLKEVWKFCGGKLHRERCGYSGIIGDYEYIVTKIQ